MPDTQQEWLEEELGAWIPEPAIIAGLLILHWPSSPQGMAIKQVMEAAERIMGLDSSGPLEAMAYSGGDIPKKWLKEVAPVLEARSKARKEAQEIIKDAWLAARKGGLGP